MILNHTEIEKTILGGWMLGEHLDDMEKLNNTDFPTYAELYRAIKKHGADIFRVMAETKMKRLEIAEITGAYAPAFYQQAMDAIAEEKARRFLEHSKDTPLPEIVETLEALRAKEVITLPEPAENLVTDYWDELDRRAKQKIIKTGLTALDRLLCGIRPKELTAIGARPSVGKSAFALQIAVNVAKQGEKVLYFPLEMSTIQTTERMMLRYMDISQERLRRGDVSWQDVSVCSDKIGVLENSGKFLIFEAVNDIEVIKALAKKHKPYMIVIDQLEQLKSSRERFKDKRERFSHMTNSLKRLTMTDDLAVWLACQVNRSAEDNEPTLSNLKESGSIEEDSDNVILLHRIAAENMETDGWSDDKRPMLINLAKQRQGATGTLNATFMANKFTFYGME